jgi:hypothetical protein
VSPHGLCKLAALLATEATRREANVRLTALLSVLERIRPYRRILVVQRALGWRPDKLGSSAMLAPYRTAFLRPAIRQAGRDRGEYRREDVEG